MRHPLSGSDLQGLPRHGLPGAMRWAQGRYYQDEWRRLEPEAGARGDEGRVPYRVPSRELHQLIGGLKAGWAMWVRTTRAPEKARFIKITSAGLGKATCTTDHHQERHQYWLD